MVIKSKAKKKLTQKSSKKIKSDNKKKRNLKKCFFISPIGDVDSPQRKRSDQLFKHMIQPIAKEYGYFAHRADMSQNFRVISVDILDHVVKDKLAIADITGLNANVFYELAVRHCAGKPIIIIRHPDTPIPFDITHIRVLDVDDTSIDSITLARKQLENAIQSSETHEEILTPVDLLRTYLKNFDSPEKEGRKLMNVIQNLEFEVRELSEKIDNQSPKSPSSLDQILVNNSALDTSNLWDEYWLVDGTVHRRLPYCGASTINGISISKENAKGYHYCTVCFPNSMLK